MGGFYEIRQTEFLLWERLLWSGCAEEVPSFATTSDRAVGPAFSCSQKMDVLSAVWLLLEDLSCG